MKPKKGIEKTTSATLLPRDADPPSPRVLRQIAVAKAVREQGIRVGAVTEHASRRFVIIKISLLQNIILMQRMDDLSANGTKSLPVVSADKAAGGYRIACPVNVVCRPPVNFSHLQAIWVYRPQSSLARAQATYRERSSLMASKHQKLRMNVLERLTSEEKYENEYGWFVLVSAVQRIFEELGVGS